MKPLAAFAALGLAALALGGGAARAQRALVPTPITALPEGEGRELVWVHCNVCHDLGPVRQQRLGRTAWEDVLADMKKFGAFYSDEQRATILEYLVRHYGPK